MTDPYSVLGITPGADDETIKKAYRQKCKQYHPDLHPDDPSAEEHFKEVQAAYSEIMRIKQGAARTARAGNPAVRAATASSTRIRSVGPGLAMGLSGSATTAPVVLPGGRAMAVPPVTRSFVPPPIISVAASMRKR